MPCKQFLNSFILKLYEGGGKLEKSQFALKKVSICFFNKKSDFFFSVGADEPESLLTRYFATKISR